MRENFKCADTADLRDMPEQCTTSIVCGSLRDSHERAFQQHLSLRCTRCNRVAFTLTARPYLYNPKLPQSPCTRFNRVLFFKFYTRTSGSKRPSIPWANARNQRQSTGSGGTVSRCDNYTPLHGIGLNSYFRASCMRQMRMTARGTTDLRSEISQDTDEYGKAKSRCLCAGRARPLQIPGDIPETA